MTREHVEAFIVDLLASRSPSTAKTRYGALRAFFSWLREEGEITESPMRNMKPPAVPEQPVPVLTDEEVRRLLKVCEGSSFKARRDTAIIRLFLDSGARCGEMAGLRVDDVDFDRSIAVVLGKGGRFRAVPFGPKTTLALRRYLRMRKPHVHAEHSALWLGQAGALSDVGIKGMLARRGAEAGIDHLHAHLFRHHFAHSWLAAGGTEGDAMKLGGWRDRSMLDRYGAAVAVDRALDAHRRLAPGDRF